MVQVGMFAHLRHGSACTSAQSDQCLMVTLWVAKGPTFLQAEN